MNEKVAVVGIGYWGKNLVRNFAQIGALGTICEANQKTLEAQAALYPGVRTATKLKEVLTDDELQAVVIATPAALHYSQVKQAILHGKDVFVEKPLALHYEEGQELVELADTQGVILMVGHILE